jgi:hypothetical protein
MSNVTARDRDIIPTNLAIKAMRDSGYRNTAYALAELIDNSAQAKASLIEVYCLEQQVKVQQRQRKRITNIAVLDNGSGMTPDVLDMALQFGNGTHLNAGPVLGASAWGCRTPRSRRRAGLMSGRGRAVPTTPCTATWT